VRGRVTYGGVSIIFGQRNFGFRVEKGVAEGVQAIIIIKGGSHTGKKGKEVQFPLWKQPPLKDRGGAKNK